MAGQSWQFRAAVKILVLCYEYPPVGGGGGRVAATVAEELAARGHEVRVLTAGLKHLPPREERNGVTILRAESFRQREDTCSVPEMGLYLLTNFWPALQLARSWRPDIIHAHFAVPTGVLAMPVGRLLGIPYVLTAHLGDVPGGVPEQTEGLFRLVNPVAKRIWARASRTTAVSSHVATLANRAYQISPDIILNGVKRSSLTLDFSEKATPKIVMLGRLSVQKNPLLAIESLARIKDLPWSFEIIGKGPLGATAREKATALGIADRIVWRGWLSAGEVSQSLLQADILLMTSLHEGLPMAAVEALQHGVAIVGSRIPGLADVISEGKNGVFCDLTAESFAQSLRRLLENRSLLTKLRQGSLERSAEFDLDRQVDIYEKVLRQAVHAKD